ncbi:MAG: 4'-phosphopantetheinyl transferase superfamily protein [Candidatus Acidiferrales bacterium]
MRRIPSVEIEQLGDRIHVWSAVLDREPRDLLQLEATLSREEKARANRFHFQRDKNRFISARGVLRELVGGYLRRTAADLEFSYGPQGKPFLSPANGSTGLCFNLSHSSGLAVYAFATERNLGIDVELVRPDYAEEDIARRYFAAQEVDDLQSLPPKIRDQGFFNCWTRKEAYLKARGMGLRIPLDSFAVSLSPDRPAQFLGGVEPCWNLVAYRPAEGYVGAVVYDGAPSSIDYFSVDLIESSGS